MIVSNVRPAYVDFYRIRYRMLNDVGEAVAELYRIANAEVVGRAIGEDKEWAKKIGDLRGECLIPRPSLTRLKLVFHFDFV